MIAMLDKDLFNISPDKISQIANTPKSAKRETEVIRSARVIFLIDVKTGLENGKDSATPLLETESCSRESINLPAMITITATIESKPNVWIDFVITSASNIFQTPQIEIVAKITTERIKTNIEK